MVTQKQIAKHLGLSQSTVTLALAGKGKVKETTRRRVFACAAELGYVPDHAAAALVGRRRSRGPAPYNIAWLTADPASRPENLLPATARRTCQRYGYGFEFMGVEHLQQIESLPRILESRGVGGLIAATQGVQGSYPESGVWDTLKMPTVALYNGSPHLPFHRVSSDNFREGERATRTALDRGYRRIGIATTRDRDMHTSNKLRFAGYLSTLFERGIAPPTPPTFELELQEIRAANLDRWAQWVEHTSLDCCIFADGIFLRGFSVDKVRRYGVGVISLFVSPPQTAHLAGYHNPAPTVARTAVRMIDSFIRQPIEYEKTVRHNRTLLIKQQWNEGTSLPPIR